jgi:hypothetical protein
MLIMSSGGVTFLVLGASRRRSGDCETWAYIERGSLRGKILFTIGMG